MIFASRTVSDIMRWWDRNVPEDMLEYPYIRTDNAPVNMALVDFRLEWADRDMGNAADILSGWSWGLSPETYEPGATWTADEAAHALKVIQKMLAVFFTAE